MITGELKGNCSKFDEQFIIELRDSGLPMY